ncbi:CHASE2 domain-containing protein [Chlamydiota bacterium]
MLAYFNPFNRFELITRDYRFRLRPHHQAANTSIVFIEIAEDSIAKIGRWPWPRKWHGTLISCIEEFKPYSISFDVLFLEKSNEEDDGLLSQAIREANNVYLPLDFQLVKPSPFLKLYKETADLSLLGYQPIYPIEEFRKKSKGMGHIWINPDEDGIVRKAPLYVEHNKQLYPHLAFKTALDYLAVRQEDIEIVKGQYIFIKKSHIGAFKIPINDHFETVINWVGPWNTTFKHYSYIDVLKSYQQLREKEKPLIDLTQLANKICLVAVTATGLYDIKPIPIEPTYPMVGVHATIISNILNKDFVYTLSLKNNLIIILLIGIILGLLIPYFKPAYSLIVTVSMVVLYLGIAFVSFQKYDALLNITYPTLTIIISFIVFMIYRYLLQEHNKKIETMKLIESLIMSAIKSIDARDPSTAGHSQRVAYYSLKIAQGITLAHTGYFSKKRFSKNQLLELVYAAWLHDIGKIGVREQVLTKGTKLSKDQMMVIETRLQYISKCMEQDSGKTIKKNDNKASFNLLEQNVKKIAKYLEIIKLANIAHFLDDTHINQIKTIADEKYITKSGEELTFLTEEETRNLSVKKGNLTDEERKEIQSHALYSHEILKEIAFPEDIKHVHKFASFHHEHIDGTGYPFGKKGKEIPLQSRIIAVADVYDALTSSDRYYKKAIPIPVALKILQEEAGNEYLDKHIVGLFIAQKLYELPEQETQASS